MCRYVFYRIQYKGATGIVDVSPSSPLVVLPDCCPFGLGQFLEGPCSVTQIDIRKSVRTFFGLLKDK